MLPEDAVWSFRNVRTEKSTRVTLSTTTTTSLDRYHTPATIDYLLEVVLPSNRAISVAAAPVSTVPVTLQPNRVAHPTDCLGDSAKAWS